MRSLAPFALASALAFCFNTAHATVIDFEGVAPVGFRVNVNPGAPYHEDGFTFTPSNDQSPLRRRA